MRDRFLVEGLVGVVDLGEEFRVWLFVGGAGGGQTHHVCCAVAWEERVRWDVVIEGHCGGQSPPHGADVCCHGLGCV